MKTTDVKVILRVPVHMVSDAARVFDFAYHNSDFAGGFAAIERFPHTFAVKKNKAGYSVWLMGPAK